MTTLTLMTLSSDSEILAAVLPKLRVVRGPDHRGEYLCWCPFHPDGNGKPPHQPNLHVSDRGFVCFACDEKGSLNRLAARLGVDRRGNVTAREITYDYCDESGNLLFQVVRKPGKQFPQRRPTVRGVGSGTSRR